MNLQHISDGTNRQIMHNIIDNTTSAVLIYEDDNFNYCVAAAAIPGCEANILRCLNVASTRSQLMIQDFLDEPKPLEEKGGEG